MPVNVYDSYVEGKHLVPVKETKEILKLYVEQKKKSLGEKAKREKEH